MKINLLEEIKKNKIDILGIIIAFIGAFILFPTFFDMGVHPIEASGYIWKSLDPSWALTLNFANIKDLTWGKDFAFTYGPLSYLSTRIGWGENKFSFLLFDIFYAINLFSLFFISFKNAINKYIVIIFIALVVIYTPTYLGGANALVMFMFLIFWIRQNIEKPKVIFYLTQILLLVLLFYIKFNTGLISFVLYYVSLFYIGFFKKDKISTVAIFAIVPIILITLFAQLLNVDIVKYIASGYQIVSGYNDVMYLVDINLVNLVETHTLSLLFILSGTLFLTLKTIKEKGNFYKNSVVFSLFAIGIFVLYKQAFVRADIGHILEFFKYGILLILCLQDFHNIKITNYKNIFVVSLVAIAFYINFKNFGSPISQLKEKMDKSSYVTGFSNFTETSGMHLFPNNNELPSSILEKIGKNTIDVYPWNIHLLFENNLNYQPRPVIQSYTAYTRYLEDLNFNHYNSVKAPKFVLYDFESIDYRYPLFDESKMNLVLLKNYQVVDTLFHNERSMLLLEKRKEAKPVKLEYLRTYAMLLDSPIVPQEGIYYEVELYNNFKGKITSIFSHSPEVSLVIKTMNNRTLEYRTSKPLLETGLFLNTFIHKTADFKKCINKDTIDDKMLIRQYNFKPKDYKLFKEKIKITEYKIE
ncbi:hypothetical protein [Flavobacterium sp.]|uniref:hypothetical protein n=1 Tax=Flavobacterium sp. TaxID=239 RepID=UPI002B4AB292|nr:hypothetical protein [Flavobacterium sp.]HLF51744.1 hypothetical protein [Flavobacterium sp.]